MWKVLGIEKTKDKNAIKNAYRDKLTIVNPEEKPEEFKALRNAYEEALAFADSEEIEANEKTEIDLWRDKLEGVYFDFKKRTDINSWRELMNEDACLGIDTKPDVEQCLIVFLMNKYYINQEIWLYLDEVFSFSDRLEELYEIYPRDFIDYVIVDGISNKEFIPYDMFVPGESGEDVDEYFKIYRQVTTKPYEEAKELIEQMKALSESHPYGDMYLNRREIYLGNETAIESSKAILGQFPNDLMLKLGYANQLFDIKRYDETIELCEEILAEASNYLSAKYLMSNALVEKQEYQKAIDILFDIMDEMGGNLRKIYDINTRIAEICGLAVVKYQEKYDNDPQDYQNLYDLIWSYGELEQIDKAGAYIQKLPVGKPSEYEYYNVLISYLFNQKEKDYARCIDCIDYLIKAAKELDTEGNAKNQRRKNRIPEFVFQKGQCYYFLDKKEEGQKIIEEAMSLAPEDQMLMTEMVQFCFRQKDYDKALSLANKLIEINPYDDFYLYILAEVHYKLGNDREAFEAINRSLDSNGSNLDAYLVKLRLLIRNEAYEEARNEIEFLENNGVKDVAEIDFWNTYMDQKEEKEDIDYLEKYKKIYEKLGDLETPPEYSRLLYIKLGQLYYHQLTKYADKSLECYNKLIAMEPDVDLWYFYSGMCSLYMKDYDAAEKAFLNEQRLNPEDYDGFYRLGQVYLLSDRYEESLEQLDKAIQVARNSECDPRDIYLMRSKALCRLNRCDDIVEAFTFLKKEYNHNSADKWIIYYLVHNGRWEEAFAYVDSLTENEITHDVLENLLKYYLVKDDYKGAVKFHKKYEKILSEEDKQENLRFIARGWNKHKKVIEIDKKNVKKDSSYYYDGLLAEAYMFAGNKKEAKKYAQIALDKVNSMFEEFLLDKMYKLTHKALYLGIAGRKEEARECLENAKKEHLCSYCEFKGCIDFDLYELYLEVMYGTREDIMKKINEGKEKWPEEETFYNVERWLKYKRYKGCWWE